MKRANEEGIVGRRIDVGTVNSYRNSSRRKSEPYVVDFMTELAKKVGVEQTQENSGETAEEKAQILLPETLSKKGIYRDFIFQQGYIICEHRGGLRMRDYTLRSDKEWNGKSPGPICSIACFIAIWQKDCGHIQIRNQQAGKKDASKDDALKDDADQQDQEDACNNIDENNDGSSGPPRKKTKMILSDRSGNPFTALREAHELLLEENQQLRERSKDEKEAFQEEIQHLKERVHFLEMQIRSTRANRTAF
ncbi:hypothetical protein ACA910_003921 [Epithemia clementina (nom. ined.)]